MEVRIFYEELAGRYRIVADEHPFPDVVAYVPTIEDAVDYIWSRGGYMVGECRAPSGVTYREAWIPGPLTLDLDQLPVVDTITRYW